jgi:hypothetical protein
MFIESGASDDALRQEGHVDFEYLAFTVDMALLTEGASFRLASINIFLLTEGKCPNSSDKLKFVGLGLSSFLQVRRQTESVASEFLIACCNRRQVPGVNEWCCRSLLAGLSNSLSSEVRL